MPAQSNRVTIRTLGLGTRDLDDCRNCGRTKRPLVVVINDNDPSRCPDGVSEWGYCGVCAQESKR